MYYTVKTHVSKHTYMNPSSDFDHRQITRFFTSLCTEQYTETGI